MTVIRHDGTFDGLLCALDEALRSGGDGVAPAEDGLRLFSRTVDSDAERARRFAESLARASSGEVLRRLLLASLASTPCGDGLFVAYCRRAFAVGGAVLGDHGDPSVRAVEGLARSVGVEAHRLTGFLRFSLRRTFWYAPCEPDHDVLPLLARHFARRFPDDDRIVHDLRRERGALCRGGLWKIVPLTRSASLPDENEPGFARLWQIYFAATTNGARRNETLQRSRMPRRYWKHLVEDPGGTSPEGGESP